MTRNLRAIQALAMTCSVLAISVATPAFAQMGFSIAVDGTHVAGDPVAPDRQRQTDRALAKTDIQVKFDGLDTTPSLNVLPRDRRSAYRPSERISFVIDTNYGAWIERAEVRIYAEGANTPLAVLPGQAGGEFVWAMPADAGPAFSYVARVYDRNGRYDETIALPLVRTERTDVAEQPDLPVWGDDRTGLRNISVHGGMVTVHGTNLPPGGQVSFLGENVPVDRSGAFVVQRILPAGDHTLAVAVAEPNGKAMVFNRDINIPSQDWFYVGMADLTLGKRWGDGSIIDANPEEFDGIYAKGRAAFYLKGKIKGEYLLTAAADTGEGPLKDLFTGMLSSDPQALLRRIDPNQYYPVYGDDSALEDDAPTRGKLYVRLERGPNSVMWGNFRTVVGDSALLRSERVLYGAAANVQSDAVTGRGDPIYQASAYAAQPGTLPARDVLRGTGGSAYVLRRQDIVPGSDTVTIEVRNANTGLLVSSTRLRAGVDYTMNAMQGIVVLAKPLSSAQPAQGAVQSGSDDIVTLVASYEFSPPGSDMSEYAFGGSGAVRLGDGVKVGVVGLSETTDERDLRVYGANVRIEPTETSFLEAEILRSEGQATPSWLSTDGGLTYTQQPAVAAGSAAHAYRLHGQAELDALFAGTFGILAGFTLEQREAGFATPDQQVTHATLAFNGHAKLQFTADLALALAYDHVDNATGARRDEFRADVIYSLGEDWEVMVGLLHRDESRPGSAAGYNGSRTDLGTRITYAPTDDLSVYGFGQATVQHSAGYGRNDRLGVGADLQLGAGWGIGGQVSAGTTGPEVVATLSHETEPGKRSYVGLRVSPEAADQFYQQNRSLSGLVMGTQQQLNEAVSVRAENSYGLFSQAGSSTSLYGIDFTPDIRWTGSASYETGRIVDPNAADFERHAVSLGLGYKDESIEWRNRAEIRFEESADGSRDRTTALLQSGLSVKTDDDWRMLAGFDGLFSRSDQSAILNGDYVEATIGAAYRPVNHDRLNALFRYTYLYDLPGPDQVSRGGTVLGPSQRSHILSVDANYDLTPQLTVGAKYGVRLGEISTTRASVDFVQSSVHLGVLRADLKLIEDWSLLLEGRALYHPEASTADLGVLAALSYDVSQNLRLGLGYNFGQFSDDLRDLTYDDHGVFFNMTAKF